MKIIRVLIVTFLSAILLSGCVRYDMGINFDSQTHGEIIQHIKLAKKLTTFSGEIVEEWFDSIQQRVRELEGKTRRLSDEEIVVTIPVNNAMDLQKKFNRFFHPINGEEPGLYPQNIDTDLPLLNSQIELNQNNFLFALRNSLNLEFDLRSLSFLSTDESNELGDSEPILNLEFNLTTPWGFRRVEGTDEAIFYSREGKKLTWNLTPGELNYLKTVFWVPSPIGIGAVVIILFVTLGSFVKYQFLPLFGIGKKPIATKENSTSV